MVKNVVVISMDDAIAPWRYRHVFKKELLFPNIDRICGQSTAFHAAYCQAPVCGPSRASFMSARSPHDTGVFTNDTSIFDKLPAQDMWSHQLKENGFYCSSGGKVHHGYRPLSKEVHNVLYHDERKRFRIDMKIPPGINFVKMGGRAKGYATVDAQDDDKYHDANSYESFKSFLDGYDGDQPFYREVGFFGPHVPYITPLRYKELYEPSTLRQPEEWQSGYDKNLFAETEFRRSLDINRPRLWRDSVRNYFSALTHVDYHLGRVWDALKASRFADDTLVAIVADHGHHMGEKYRFGKTTLWEQVAGVPLIIHDPTRPVAQEVHDPVALIDLGRTILDFVDIEPREIYRGKSLRPVVHGARDPDRAVPTFHKNNVAIKKGKYRLIRYEDGSFEFFNIEDDLWQLKDLGKDHPEFAETYFAMIDVVRDYGFRIPGT